MKKNISELAEITSQKLSKENVSIFAKSLWFELQKQKKLGQLDNLILQIKEKTALKNGKISARISSATVLTEDDITEIQEKLEKKYDKKVEIENVIDKSLLGGLKINISDEVLDFSYKGKLNKLREKLAGSYE